MLSRDLLLSDVWGYNYTGGTRTVDVHIRRLREKLPPLSDAHRDHQAVRLQARRPPVTFRTRLFLTSLATAAADAARRHGARVVVGPCRRPTSASSGRWSARRGSPPKRCRTGRQRPTPSSTRRPTRSAASSARGSRSSRPTVSSSATRSSMAKRWRRSKTTARGRKCSRRGANGIGIARRYSTTVRADMLYVALRSRTPRCRRSVSSGSRCR